MSFFKKLFSKKKEPHTVSCDEARDAVLLTGGLRIVCPDDEEPEKDAAHIVVEHVTDENTNK